MLFWFVCLLVCILYTNTLPYPVLSKHIDLQIYFIKFLVTVAKKNFLQNAIILYAYTNQQGPFCIKCSLC